MNRSWVRFPQAAQIRPPGFGWAFLCARVVLRCCLWLCGPTGVSGAAWLALMGRAAVCAGGRRPAREIATREPAARSGRSRSPARPRHRPRAPQPGPPIPSAPCLEARPGPAAAHGHRSQGLRRPPHLWGVVADRWLGASARCPARPRRHPRAPRLGAAGEVTRLSETIVAFARLCLCGIETAIAFAGEKWEFLVQFSGAEVMPVSTVAVQGRAEASSVSRSPRCHAWCVIFFALLV